MKSSRLTTCRKCRVSLASADGAPVMWPLYEQVHRIISRKFANTTVDASEGSIEHKDVSVNLEAFLTPLAASMSSPSLDSNAFTSPPLYSTQLPASTNARASKKQNSEKIISMCECLKASADEKNQLMKEMIKVEREKLEVLKDLRDDNKKLTKAILDYLSRKQ